MLTGQAKTDYQREYMRRRRSNNRTQVKTESVRPVIPQLVRPEQQSYNPMMVSYVPPVITKTEQHIDASQIDTVKALHAAIATTNRIAQDSRTQPKG